MNNLPLHPAVVHLPLGIAIILPLLAMGIGIAIWRGWFPAKVWGLVAALHLLLVVSAVYALKTGEKEEEKVEAVVGESALETHEGKAERFVWAAGLTMLLSGGALFFGKGNSGLMVRSFATLGLVAVAGLGLSVGHSGGTLVYRQGAAQAYLPSTSGPGQVNEGKGLPSGGAGGENSGDRD